MSPRDERSKHVHADPPAAATAQGLVDRSALALIAVERTRMPMVVTDPRQADNPIILANQAFLNLTGYTAEEVVGRNCRFLQGPDTSPLVVAELASAIAEPRQTTVEIKNYRKDGTPFWNELHLSPIHDDAGELAYFFASQIDRTEYRKVVSLEAAEHRLLKEVDHRALNVLAIVQGIVRLSRSEDPARYARAVQARVQVLATAHSLLAERKWSHIPMDRLVQRYVGPFGIRPEALAGPPAPVRAEIVQPLAIVLHELADNAVTHGALSAANGSVRISWDLDTDQSLQLRWVETGGPPPAAVRGRGFGSLMIAAIIDRQLKGRSELDWFPEGLSARITIPHFEAPLQTDAPERDARASGALRRRAERGGLTA